MARTRDNTILFTGLGGQRSAWHGRQPKGYRTTNSFAEFCRRARLKTKPVIPGDNQLHLERHHRGFDPKKVDQ